MNAVNSASTYQETATAIAGTTGTGLDQLISIIGNDPGLQRKVAAADIAEGAMAANSMNALIIEAIRETGIANDAQLSVADVRDINAYLRSHYLNEWSVLHGDDEESGETGFHLVQRDGAMTSLYGRNAVNGVADGLYPPDQHVIGRGVVRGEDRLDAATRQVLGFARRQPGIENDRHLAARIGRRPPPQ